MGFLSLAAKKLAAKQSIIWGRNTIFDRVFHICVTFVTALMGHMASFHGNNWTGNGFVTLK